MHKVQCTLHMHTHSMQIKLVFDGKQCAFGIVAAFCWLDTDLSIILYVEVFTSVLRAYLFLFDEFMLTLRVRR